VAEPEPWRIEELTAPGPGGVSVLRLSGPGALARLRELGVDPPPEGELRVARLRRGEEDLDEAVVLVRGPEEVELHVHGSPPLVRSLLSVAPASEPRALEAAAAERLARAPVELTARVLLAQAEGALRRELEAWEAHDDRALVAAAASLEARSRAVAPALSPARVLLAGPVNAGKSTLFNALVGETRAITSAEPGTTRDLLIEPAQLGAWPVLVLDTAGLRPLEEADPAAGVERAGQELALRRAGGVDWILWLDPPSGGLEPPDLVGVPLTRLASRTERAEGIRALEDPEGAARRVAELFREALRLEARPDPSGPVVFLPEDLDGLGAAGGQGPAALRAWARELLGR
jgi:tRNA modification GTPase